MLLNKEVLKDPQGNDVEVHRLDPGKLEEVMEGA